MSMQLMILTFWIIVAAGALFAWFTRIPTIKLRAIRNQRFRIFLTISFGLTALVLVYITILRLLVYSIALELHHQFTVGLTHEIWLQMLTVSTNCFSGNLYVCELAAIVIKDSVTETWLDATLLIALPHAFLSGLLTMFLSWRFTQYDNKQKAKREIHPNIKLEIPPPKKLPY